MNTQPTPETDAAYKNHAADMHDHIPLDFARKLERERDEARESLEFQRKLNVELNERAKCDLKNMTEQRDRLAEALTDIASGIYNEDGCIYKAERTLQSLTPKP
jgi:hypothetical protein